MPVTPTYPGVYIEEIPSGVRTIVGVPTSVAAFIGRAWRGPTDEAVTLNGFGDFERIFGGLWTESTLGFAVRDFFLNGGGQAITVRLFHAPFASDKERAKAEDAAKAVSSKVQAAANPAAAADDAQSAANDYNDKSEAEKTAAQSILSAVKAAKTAGADLAGIKAAAETAVIAATPVKNAKLTVGALTLEAAHEGSWGANLRASVDQENISPDVASAMGLGVGELFNLSVLDAVPGGLSERFVNLSVKESSRQVNRVLEAESQLLRWRGTLDPSSPPAIVNDDITAKTKVLAAAKKGLEDKKRSGEDVGNEQNAYDEAKAALEVARNTYWNDDITAKTNDLAAAKKGLEDKRRSGEDAGNEQKAYDEAKAALEVARNAAQLAVSDGKDLTIQDFSPPNGEADKKGLYALEQLFARDGLFNLLCIPPYLNSGDVLGSGDVDVSLVAEAAAYCERRRAMLLVDPPSVWKTKDKARSDFTDVSSDKVGTRSRNAALFFPRLKQPNPLRENRTETFAPCGAVAGVIARTDTQRGVWKAPAGLDAKLTGVPELSVPLTDAENGELNPLGINCLRSFPIGGRVVWGARTLRGADQLADEYKYLPVRRTALFLEESLYRGLKWVVFEPNDEPLWAQIRLNVGAFMQNLFRQGAFQGKTPREAYFVKCDRETTTQNDINLGIVNIVVGFAPLKPAEFVIVKVQQLAGQIEV